MSNEAAAVPGNFNKLMDDAIKQLDEHKAWLKREIMKMPVSTAGEGPRDIILAQVDLLKVRLVQAHNKRANIVYDYPDELYVFLRSEHASPELRASLVGGHVVDQNKPAFTFERAPDDK